MNDQPDIKKEAAAPKRAPLKKADAEKPADNRTAKIKTLVSEVKAKGFTLGKGQTVPGVPLAHAEHLVSKGRAEILEVR